MADRLPRIILRHKSTLFKDPESVRDAAISGSSKAMIGWRVCIDLRRGGVPAMHDENRFSFGLLHRLFSPPGPARQP
jgi:hypothetical protein